MLSVRDLAHKYASDYIDGQLGWRRRLIVIFHLLMCQDCRRFIHQMRQVRGVVLRRPVVADEREDTTPSDAGSQENDHVDKLARVLLAEFIVGADR